MRNRVVSEGSEAKSATPYADIELPLDWTAQLAVGPATGGRHKQYQNKEPGRTRQNGRAGHPGAAKHAPEPLGGISAALLADLQQEVGELERDRGTSRESVVQKSLVLSEEAFEVLKVLRPRAGIATAKNVSRVLADELADILFVVAAIANRVDAHLGTLWEAVRSDAESDGPNTDRPNEDKVLEASIDLAQQILAVIVNCRGFEARGNHLTAADLAGDLRELLLLVQVVATTCDVDMRKAIETKLNKDQLRLWST
jgi:NTP pyrophosphatase (non-canonical NTP hydrolase)